MSGEQKRGSVRKPVYRFEMVTVFHDHEGYSYQQSIEKIDDDPLAYTVFNVVARLRDVSYAGMGIAFEGQQITAAASIKVGAPYLLQLPISREDVTDDLSSYVKREQGNHLIFIKAMCRWYDPKPTPFARVGFELSPHNPEAILDFVKRNFSDDLAQ